MSLPDVLVRNLMTTEVVTLREDEDLTVAEGVMALKRIRHLPVVREGALVGLVTHRDLLSAQMSSTAELTARERVALERRVQAHEVMRRDVATVSPDTTILQAARVMRENRYGCLPVVHEGNQLVGILTEADFLELVIELLGAMTDG